MSVQSQNPVATLQLPSKPQRTRLSNGAAPTTNPSRRKVQADLQRAEYEGHLEFPPAAPEVPQGAPISYNQQYEGESIGRVPARSFSQRAKAQMLAQEALEDNEYWDDQEDDVPSQVRLSENDRNSTGQNFAAAPRENGLNATHNGRETRRSHSPSHAIPSIDSSQSTPKAPREHSHPLRHSADVAPLKLDVGAPPAPSSTVRDSRPRTSGRRKEWASDRSPLQTLEVKLNDISKEEKRARVEEAEMLLRESKVGRGGRRLSKEMTASPKESPSTRETFRRPQVPGGPQPDGNLSPRQRNKLHREARIESLRPDVRDSSGADRGGVEGHLQQIARKPAAEDVPDSSNQLRSRPQPPRDLGQTHPAHGVSVAVSPGRNQPEYPPEPTMFAAPHPAHDPRLIRNGGRISDETEMYADGRSNRIQKDVRRASSTRQAPIARSIPSNITRAVSLQQHQPQPAFPDDHDVSRLGPMRESNSSHKAALVEATAAIGAAGATASTSVKRDSSTKLQKAAPETVNRGSYSGTERPELIPDPVTQISASAKAPLSDTKSHAQSPKIEFYYKGMPKQVDVQRSNTNPQRGPEGVGLGLKGPALTEQSNVTNRPRQTSVSFKVPFDKARPVNEWKQAGTARLKLADLALDLPSEHDQAWWESNGSSGRRRSKRSSGTALVSDAYSQQEDTKNVEFKPTLYLKCGPLLRYTGLRKDRGETQAGQTSAAIDRETWRGSVMIVTHDSMSSYTEVPTLRLFSQPRDLLPPPPEQVKDDDLAPEYVDPIAGLTKVSRRGRILYVKPVDHLEEGKDLSLVATDDGLFETSPSSLDSSPRGNTTPNSRTRGRDGESLGKYREVKGVRLYADIERDVTFWRFNIEVELGDQQAHIAYRINRGPPVGFWVPAKGQTMNIMFHSCNGFSLSVNPDQFSGPDPLWRDVLNTHQTRPFHVMIGGGDQLYNDRVMVDTKLFASWTQLKNPIEKHHAPFIEEMREELESFYLDRYAMWFSQGLFGLANSQIPMVNIYDDHDIIDGFGSYPDDFQRAPVFMGIGNVAFKYYMLFQHQSVPEETEADEPSWLLGARPGPYIQQLSRSVFMKLGRHIAFLGLDCRTERERYSVLTDDTYEIVLERCRKEIEEGETKHLLVLLGVPIAYPRLVWLENVLTSRAMAPVKALGRAGIFKGGFLNKFDGGVEVLDDLDDHWTATGHKEERNNLVRDLQELAAEKSVRITILGGDVHLAAVGQFYSNPKLGIPKDKDHRYIPNVISSAIVNTPPPEMLADTLNKRNKVHHLDHYTVEDMIPMFTHDVTGSKRNNKRLLPRRNWCSIREYHPGSTPPPTPPESVTPSDQMYESEDYPPQSRRRFSFSREDANPRKLFRRLSQRGAPPSSYRDDMVISSPLKARRASHDGYFPNSQQPQTAPATRTSFPMNNTTNPQNQPQTAPPHRSSFTSPTSATASYNHSASIDALPSAPYPRPGIFRRPTNLSEKAAKKGGPPQDIDSQGNLINQDFNDHINLDGGLDITLNCEVNQGDPAGITTPYRLLVPALYYDGSSDSQKLDGPEPAGVQRKPTLLKKLGFGRTGNRSVADRQGEGNWGQPSESGSETYSEGQYSQEDDDGYYEKEQKSSGGGGLKRWFSRRNKQRESWKSDRDFIPARDPPGYEQVGAYPPLQPQRSAQAQQLSDEFVGKELKTTPPLLQQPIEPFPSQARGKAARIMGVDQGPLPTFAQPSGTARAPPQPQQEPRPTQPTPMPLASSMNASLPLPPPSSAPATGTTTRSSTTNNGQGRRNVPPAAAMAGTGGDRPTAGSAENGNRFYSSYDGAPPLVAGQAVAARARQRGGAGQGQGLSQMQAQVQAQGGRVVHGYDGVEAYTAKPGRRGSVLRKWSLRK